MNAVIAPSENFSTNVEVSDATPISGASSAASTTSTPPSASAAANDVPAPTSHLNYGDSAMHDPTSP
ncbi:MAG: hypothetical protein ACO38K_10460, partial [Ilumatobacteraceae bacterium]